MLSTSDVIYLIVTDRFFDGDASNNRDVDRSDPSKRHGGDLLGIVQKLPYLKELGVTTLWVSPVYPNPPTGYHGYHALDFEGVDAALCSPELGPPGSRETVRRFCEIVHGHGLKLMLDLVVGHSAPEHPWVGGRPHWYDRPGEGRPDKDWFFGLANLNHDLLDVNVYFLENVLRWAGESGADAVRIDAARHVETTFWKYLKLYAPSVVPHTPFVAEFWDADPQRVAVFQNLHGFGGAFDFPLYEAVREVFCREASVRRLARPRLSGEEAPGVLDLDDVYRNANGLVTFVGNHDTPRLFSAAGGEADPALAEARLRLALTLQMTVRGVPQLYYGDELAVPGGTDPGCRADMPWHWLDGGGGEAGERGRRTLEFTRRLIRLRRGSSALRLGLTVTLFVGEGVLIYARLAVDDVVLVALNNEAGDVEIDVPVRANAHIPEVARAGLRDGTDLVETLCSTERVCIRNGHVRLRVPGRTPRVYRGATTSR